MPDTDEAVRALLHAAADPPGGPLHAPVDAVLSRARRRQHRRRAALLGAVAVVAALAVTIPVAVVSGRDGRADPAEPAPTDSVDKRGTVAALDNDTWKAMPPAPLTPRDGAAVAWTGEQMLIWGGAGDRAGPYGDGAAYDPSSHRWSSMPPSPLSARSYPLSAWTPKGLFIWGGHGPDGNVPDGALYDATTHSWHVLPRAPLPDGDAVGAVNAAGQVVVLVLSGGTSARPVQAATYDPATNRWRQLPSPPTDDDKSVEGIHVVAAGASVYLLSSWSHSHSTSQPHVIETNAGTDVLTLAHGAKSWRSVAAPDQPIPNITPFWTGRVLIWPPASPFRPGIAQGPPSLTSGLMFDPSSGRWSQMESAPGSNEAFAPLSDAGWVWTGSTLVGVFGPPGIYSGTRPPDTLNGGAAVAWDAATGRWSVLRPPTVPLREPSEVWTGQELLLWGTVLRQSEPDKPGVSPSPRPPEEAKGLVLGP